MKDKDSADATYWRCEKREICSSRMITFIASGLVKRLPQATTMKLILPLSRQQKL